MMKNSSIFLYLIAAIIFTSCSVGHSNFNKQKYTHLKPLKVECEVPSRHVKPLFPSKIKRLNTVEVASVEFVRDDQVDPKRSRIQKAIANEEQIFVKMGQQLYRLKSPMYDVVYDAIIGELLPFQGDEDEGLLISVDQSYQKLEKDYIYLKEITGLKEVEIKKESNNHLENEASPTHVKPEHSKSETIEIDAPRKSLTTAEVSNLKIKRSEAGRRAKRNHVAAILSLLGIGLGVLILIYSGGAVGIILGALVIIAMLLMGYIGRLIAAINYRKHKQYSDKLGLKPGKEKRTAHAFTWVGLAIYGIATLGILLLLALAVYFLATSS